MRKYFLLGGVLELFDVHGGNLLKFMVSWFQVRDFTLKNTSIILEIIWLDVLFYIYYYWILCKIWCIRSIGPWVTRSTYIQKFRFKALYLVGTVTCFYCLDVGYEEGFMASKSTIKFYIRSSHGKYVVIGIVGFALCASSFTNSMIWLKMLWVNRLNKILLFMNLMA